MEEKTKTTPPVEEKYELIFKNGALANLKELAGILNVPQDDLKQVVSKSINLLNLAKNAKTLVLEDHNGNRYYIDLKKI